MVVGFSPCGAFHATNFVFTAVARQAGASLIFIIRKLGSADLQVGCGVGLLARTGLLAARTPPVQPLWRAALLVYVVFTDKFLDQPRRRVPHPFALFAKGWDTTTPASRPKQPSLPPSPLQIIFPRRRTMER
jgi:hypothetical protein